MRIPLRLNPLQWRNPFYWLNPYYWVPPREVTVESRTRRFWRGFMIALHVLLVVGIAAGLWYVNRRYHVGTELLSPFPRLHAFWLPLLFLLVYAGAWLGYWFFRLLLDPTGGDHPDIDAAFAEGMAAVDAAGIDATEVPLFLVVGTPAGGTADFFAATKLPFAVRAEPRRADAPVRVYANREAIFVTAEGASVLAKLSQLLAARPSTAARLKAAGLELTMMGGSSGSVDLLDAPSSPVVVTAGDASPVAAAGLSPVSSLSLVDIGSDSASDWLPKPAVGAFVGVPADEADRLAARLRYLGGLIADRRNPYCPANGTIWLVPPAGLETDTLSEQVAAACRADLEAVETGLQVHAPAAAVVCDAQEFIGFRDLVKGLADGAAQERLFGRSFPLAPNVSPEQRADVFTSGLGWVVRHMVPGVVYQRFGTEAEGNGTRWSDANARMYLLTAALADRRTKFTRVLSQGLSGDGSRPPLLAGAYFAGTGPDAGDQAFAAGVVKQLVGMQNGVTWTAAAEAEEVDYRRMAGVGYAAILIAVVVVGMLAYSTWVG